MKLIKLPPMQILLMAITTFGIPLHAAEVIVNIQAPESRPGQIGCGLFAGPTGFPMDNSAARMQWIPMKPGGTTCRFTDVADGTYAVSVLNDENGNRMVDTNFLGMPKEDWAVSNNVRPSLRAPRFDEAAFKVVNGENVILTLKLAR